MTEFDDFLTAIADRPDDPLRKLIFADYLDEHGDARGACLRWMVARQVGPVHDTGEGTWDWWARRPREPDYYASEPPDTAVLPAPMFRRLKCRPTDIWKGYDSYRDALRDLLAAWSRCAAEGIQPLDAGVDERAENGIV